ESEIAAREATEKARIAQTTIVNVERIASDERTRALEIQQVRSIQEAEIEAQKAVEAARIARERTLAAERIGSDHATRKLKIERNQALEVAGIAAREATEASRIAQEERVRALDRAQPRRRGSRHRLARSDRSGTHCAGKDRSGAAHSGRQGNEGP